MDPIWDEGSYHVIGHETELQFIYFRDDGAIEFIQDASEPDIDYIYYFPNGLSEDPKVWGVWDYNHKYSNAQCAVTTFNNAAGTSSSDAYTG